MATGKLFCAASNAKHFLKKEDFDSVKQKLSNKAYFQNWDRNGKSFIVRVPNCFDESTVDSAIKNLHEDRRAVKNEVVENNGVTRRDLIGDVLNSWVGVAQVSTIVKFDNKGLLNNNSELDQEFRRKSVKAGLKQLTLAGLNNMAKAASWQSCEVPIACSVIKYPIDIAHPTQSELPWHFDSNSLTFTCVLNEPIDEGGQFSGGELMFAERKKGSFYFTDPHTEYTKGTPLKFKYKPYSSLMFENMWTVHKVNDIVFNPESEGGFRYLFSIFANPTPEQFKKTRSQCEYTNLATFSPQSEQPQRKNWLSCFG